MEPSRMDFRTLETGRTEYFFYYTQNCLWVISFDPSSLDFLYRAYYFSICINRTYSTDCKHSFTWTPSLKPVVYPLWQSSCHGQTLSLLAHEKSQSFSTFLSHCQWFYEQHSFHIRFPFSPRQEFTPVVVSAAMNSQDFPFLQIWPIKV